MVIIVPESKVCDSDGYTNRCVSIVANRIIAVSAIATNLVLECSIKVFVANTNDDDFIVTTAKG